MGNWKIRRMVMGGGGYRTTIRLLNVVDDFESKMRK